MSFINVLNSFFKPFGFIIFFLLNKVKCVDIFKGILKLSLNDNYFVALNTGLFLYNYNLLNYALITNFNSSVYKNDDNDIIIIKEFLHNKQYYIFCMVNKYLFLFNEKSNITNTFLIDEDDIISTNYYELLPYKVDNNKIYFFISLNKGTSDIFLFYYKILLEASKMEKISSLILHTKVINKLMKCFINNYNSEVSCFYVEQINNINYLQLFSETISEFVYISNSEIISDIIMLFDETCKTLTSTEKEINEFKVVSSSNNKFFIAILIDGKLYLFIYEFSTNNLLETGCNDGEGANINYKLYYFEETKDFVIVDRIQDLIYIINSYNNSSNICSQKYFPQQSEDYDFNIIYNNTINNYSLINHLNFENEVQNSELIIIHQIFLDLIKVPFHNNYFVILNTGLFLYNFDTLDCALLYSFNSSIIRNSDNRINVTDLIYDNYLYILSLVNEYFFVFNINNNRTYCYKINNIDFTGNYYYNILGYKAQKYNISFIIVYHKEETKLNFYYYNFSLREGINEPKVIVSDGINIKNNLVRCSIINKISQIFYYFYNEEASDNINNHYLSLVNYFIEDMNVNLNQTYNFQTSDYINQIKIVFSSNNNFFICISVS